MTLFSELFEQSQGKPIIYKNKTIYRAFTLSGPKKIKIIVTFIGKNSKFNQGISFNMFTMEGKLICNGHTINKGGFEIWEHSSPKNFELNVEIYKGELNIFNICEDIDHRGSVYEVNLTMGMAFYYEEISNNKYRFYCNDWEPDDDFDDLIFDIEFVNM
jgi:hypothetical protein